MKTKIDNKGFTLIEIIITLAIGSIVLLSMFSFFNQGNRTFVLGKTQYNAQSEVRLATDYIVDNIRYLAYASLLTSFNSADLTDSDTMDYIYFENGSLIHSSYNNGNTRKKFIYGDVLQNSSYFSSYKIGEQQSLEMMIVGINDNQEYSLRTEISLPNININRAYMADESNAKAIRFFVKTALDTSFIPPESVEPPNDEEPPEETAPSTNFITFTIIFSKEEYKVFFNTEQYALTKISGNEYHAIINNIPSGSWDNRLRIEQKDKNTYVEIRNIYPYTVEDTNFSRLIADIPME